MAGNTKLLGFSPKGEVVLERWGGKAVIQVSSESLDELREACTNKLPRDPQIKHPCSDYRCAYDYSCGSITLTMNILGARSLCYLINSYIKGAGEEVTKTSNAKNLLKSIEDNIQAHLNYTDTGEPGIEETDVGKLL